VNTYTRNILGALVILVTMASCGDSDDIQNGGFPVQPEEPVPGSIHLSATYRVEIDFNWNDEDFPIDFPVGENFNDITGLSHTPGLTYFDVDSIASPGLAEFSTTGTSNLLTIDLDSLVADGIGLQRILGNGTINGTNDLTFDINVDSTRSAVSLISMMNPSPDWYVGVIDEDLYLDRTFIFQRTVNALVYDGGTDSGITYTSADTTTTPQQAISLLTAPPLGNGTTVEPAVATIRFTRMSVVTN